MSSKTTDARAVYARMGEGTMTNYGEATESAKMEMNSLRVWSR